MTPVHVRHACGHEADLYLFGETPRERVQELKEAKEGRCTSCMVQRLRRFQEKARELADAVNAA